MLRKAEYNRETKAAEAKVVLSAARTKRNELDDLERLLARCPQLLLAFEHHSDVLRDRRLLLTRCPALPCKPCPAYAFRLAAGRGLASCPTTHPCLV